MDLHPETLAVQAGQEQPDPATGARAVPIYQTTSFVFEDTEHAAELFALKRPGNIYTRIMNPTQQALEERVNALEGGVGALATASGAAAVTYAVLNLCQAGDNIVALSTLYGGTYALLAHTLPQFGIETRFVDPDKPDELAQHVDDRTKAVFGETIGNPAINVIDLDAWSGAAHELGLPFILDNTVATPVLTRAFQHGVDIVVHSATKFLGGHGTSLGGLIVDSGNFDWESHADRFRNMAAPDPAYHGVVWTQAAGKAAFVVRARTVLLRNTGAAISPFNAFLLLQGIETLHLRMERHSDNALAVARFLESHPGVAWVNYPGLDSSASHAVAKRVLDSGRFGGILSFGLRSGREGGARFVDSLRLFSHLANIGDAKSLVIHSASTTHSQLTEEELKKAGVPAEMVRLSVGIEHVADLIADLDQALRQA
ncbi:O-acetylhomoserine aminocarboxypropyltransferase/cysteine synthase family protein [Tessaracoccus sp. OH4464_COT-324]|uniref:O-acetylhomoserine aminocarboxypropyltransferase/cysteine synthase family protein n=1 Tax=Tessaracoccus sp. OH4464_COT-324 TaxID=2491059 RepID=UPI000F6332F3|nr:O-acetylhomoserine aminocarboxypropyltransferase/cysteine synthase family protein [Tessaracoccus sp. OH4464_COT-324]RRD47996.1 O-acetylhomoserine aminocarboxypropyltransferase/cysteine synthase [Tessaracoccus sp. OH4464_COT-324]